MPSPPLAPSFALHPTCLRPRYSFERPPPAVPSSHYPRRPAYIRVAHPDYPDGDNTLVRLPLLDPVYAPNPTPPANSTTAPSTAAPSTASPAAIAEPEPAAPPSAFGIHYGTLFSACCIVACNTPGRLCVDREGTCEIAPTRWDDVITGLTACYYHVFQTPEGPALPYPTHSSFWHWDFPHSALPARWLDVDDDDVAAATDLPFAHIASATRMTSAVQQRDGSCRLTSTPEGCENSHVVPVEEDEWFKLNRMFVYNLNQQIPSVRDVANGILGRADLHKLWDRKMFTYVPKGGSWAVHCFQYSESVPRIFHNRRLHPLRNVAPEFLYARFAWTVFGLVESEVQSGRVRRRYRVRITEGSGANFSVKAPEIRNINPLNPAELRLAVKPPSSPRKRKAPGPADEDGIAFKRSCHRPSHPDISSSEPEDDHREFGWPQSRSSASSLCSETRTLNDVDGDDDDDASTEDMRTGADIERQARFLIETEHPLELFGALIPAVGEETDDRLRSTVVRMLQEQQANEEDGLECCPVEAV